MKTKILFIVEGEVEEIRILGNKTYGLLKLIDSDYEVIPFANPIYELYEAYINGEYDDIVQYLRYYKGLKIPRGVLSKNYFSAIYLIFDFEAHYQKYSDKTILNILEVFSNETENGKIYINYPMVESFYHLKSLPDENYKNSTIKFPLKSGKEYKKIVNLEMAFPKNKISDEILELIILQNFEKSQLITNSNKNEIDYKLILAKQIEQKNKYNMLYILSTFPLMLIDYNNEVLEKIKKSVEKKFQL